MSINPGVRVLAEGTETLIAELPINAPSLAANDSIIISEVGSSAISYKIEAVRYYVEFSNLIIPELPDSYSVYGRTDLIVSVIP